MSGPDSISDPVASRHCCTESYPSARSSAQLQNGSAQLGAAQLAAGDVACGPTMLTCLMTWHADWTLTRLLTGCWLCILASWLRHDDVILIQVWHVVRVVWYSGRVSSSGWRRRVWRVSRVGNFLAGAWWCVRRFPTSDFDAVFNSGFVSSSSTQWYGQNTILTTFIFEQNQTPL